MQALSQWQLLQRDIVASWRQWPFWTHLGWQDVLRQYRRSFLGPTWIAINTAVFTAAFGWLGAQLFKQDAGTYISHFCLGNVFFGFMTSTFNDGCRTYMDASSFLKQAAYPKFCFVLRVVWRNLLLLAHQLPLIVVVLAFGGKLGGALWGWWLLGMLMCIACAVLVVALLGLICARYRDVPMMVSSLLQIAFFVTPVMWHAELLTSAKSQLLVTLNPLAAWLSLMRGPLLGQAAPVSAWLVAGLTLLVLTGLCALAYVLARKRITYWL